MCRDFSTITQTVWVQLQPSALHASEELSFEQASLGAVPIVTLTNGTDMEVIRAEWNPVSTYMPPHTNDSSPKLIQVFIFHNSGSEFLDGTPGEQKLGKLW